MNSRALIFIAAAVTGLGFAAGISPDTADTGYADERQSAALQACDTAAMRAAFTSDGCDMISPDTCISAPVTGGEENTGDPGTADTISVYVNGRLMPDGYAEAVGDEIYVCADLFCGFLAPPGGYPDDTYPVTAEPGDCYIRCGDRCIPCSANDAGTTVTEIGGLPFVPAAALASASGMRFVTTDVGGSFIGIPSFPDAGDIYSDTDLYWLSRIIFAESGGEPFTGQLAVGSVVLNRVRSSLFPSDIYGVIFDDRFGVQFTPAYSGSVYRDPSASAVLAARMCLEGFSVSDDILFFFNSSLAKGDWITSNRTYAMTIGKHDFYC